MRDEEIVRRFVEMAIRKIEHLPDPSRRGVLAKLRRGVGKRPGEVPEIWDITLLGLPDSCIDRELVEESVHTALTFYALHMQSKDEELNKEGVSFGAAVARLRGDNNEIAIKRRFDASITSKNSTEFAYHARGFVRLFRGRGIPLDYPAFAEDVYRLQKIGSKNKVMLKWGRDFYRTITKIDVEEGEQS